MHDVINKVSTNPEALGTIALEILKDLPDVEVVVVPIGGGGLISGIALALKIAEIIQGKTKPARALSNSCPTYRKKTETN